MIEKIKFEKIGTTFKTEFFNVSTLKDVKGIVLDGKGYLDDTPESVDKILSNLRKVLVEIQEQEKWRKNQPKAESKEGAVQLEIL